MLISCMKYIVDEMSTRLDRLEEVLQLGDSNSNSSSSKK